MKISFISISRMQHFFSCGNEILFGTATQRSCYNFLRNKKKSFQIKMLVYNSFFFKRIWYGFRLYSISLRPSTYNVCIRSCQMKIFFPFLIVHRISLILFPLRRFSRFCFHKFAHEFVQRNMIFIAI